MDKIKKNNFGNFILFFLFFPDKYSRRVCKSTNKTMLSYAGLAPVVHIHFFVGFSLCFAYVVISALDGTLNIEEISTQINANQAVMKVSLLCCFSVLFKKSRPFELS